MQPNIEFIHENYTFVISDYITVGPKLSGMNDNKIFYDNGHYYKNHNNELVEINSFVIQKEGKEISIKDYKFDTTLRVGGVIIHNDELLIIHRFKDGREYYVFPGGHLKVHESPQEALLREIYEETSIKLSKHDLITFLIEIQQERFGPEMYFMVELKTKPPKVFENNPEDKLNQSKLVWMNIKDATRLNNLLPKGIISLV